MHGLTQTAASLLSLRDYFYERGYNRSQLFGTSYGPLGRPILFDDESKCEHYKAVGQGEGRLPPIFVVVELPTPFRFASSFSLFTNILAAVCKSPAVRWARRRAGR